MAGKARLQKINKEVRSAIMSILEKEVSDPRFQLLTVTAVDISRDIRHGKVFFTMHGKSSEEISEVSEALNRAAGFIQSRLSDLVRLRFTPKLTFIYDDSTDRVERLEDLFKRLNDEK